MVDLSLLLMADHMVLAGRVVTLASTERMFWKMIMCVNFCASPFCAGRASIPESVSFGLV